MTQPRMLLPGRTYLVTRRVRDRVHLFRPDAKTGQVFSYCLFAVGEQVGIEVHAAVLMSNHLHLVVTDPHGHISLFLARFHLVLAKCTQALRNWRGTVFEDCDPSVVPLLSPQAVVQAMGYVVANPVKSHLVARASDWPGVSAWRNHPDKRWPTVSKPRVYFRKRNGRYPPTVSPVFSLPEVLKVQFGEHGARRAVNNEIRRIQSQALAERTRSGQAVLGAARIKRGSTRKRTTVEEPPVSLNPHFAVGRGQRALFKRAVKELKAFRDAYRRAFSQWKKGDREVCFPPGTFWMVHVHGANVTT